MSAGAWVAGGIVFLTFIILIIWLIMKSTPSDSKSCSDYKDESNCTANSCSWDGTGCNDKKSPTNGGGDSACSSKSEGDICTGSIENGIYECTGKPIKCMFSNQCKMVDGVQYNFDPVSNSCKKPGRSCNPPSGKSTPQNSSWEFDENSNTCVNVCNSGYSKYQNMCLKEGDTCTPASGGDKSRFNYEIKNGNCVITDCVPPYETMPGDKNIHACNALNFGMSYAGAGYKTMFKIYDNTGKAIHSTAHGEEDKNWKNEFIPEGGYLEGYCNDTPANAKGKRGYVTYNQLETVLKKSTNPIVHNWCPNGQHVWGSTLSSDSFTRWDNGDRPICSDGVCKFKKSNSSAGVRSKGDAPV